MDTTTNHINRNTNFRAGRIAAGLVSIALIGAAAIRPVRIGVTLLV